jgi:hypothetical protein
MMMMMMHVSIIYMYIRTDYPSHVSFLSRVETIWYICMCSFIWLLSRFKKNCSKSPRSKTPIWAYKRCNSHWLVPIYHWVICTILKHNSHNFSIVLPKLNHWIYQYCISIKNTETYIITIIYIYNYIYIYLCTHINRYSHPLNDSRYDQWGGASGAVQHVLNQRHSVGWWRSPPEFFRGLVKCYPLVMDFIELYGWSNGIW